MTQIIFHLAIGENAYKWKHRGSFLFFLFFSFLFRCALVVLFSSSNIYQLETLNDYKLWLLSWRFQSVMQLHSLQQKVAAPQQLMFCMRISFSVCFSFSLSRCLPRLFICFAKFSLSFIAVMWPTTIETKKTIFSFLLCWECWTSKISP